MGTTEEPAQADPAPAPAFDDYSGIPEIEGVLMADAPEPAHPAAEPAAAPEKTFAGVRELGPDETHLAYRAVLALGRRVNGRAELNEKINGLQRPEGFRLVASFEEGDTEAAAFAGFRFGHSLAWGYFMYIDDMATREECRGKGHAGALMKWLLEEARNKGCDGIHLDSGITRHDAHRMYLNHRYAITSHHFSRKLKG